MLLPRLRQLAALALTVIVLLGIPYLLIAVVTWPNPDLSWLSIQAHLRGWRLPPGVLTTVLLAALWGVWALYLLAFLSEAATWLRRGPVRLRPLGPLQVLAATALGTVTTTSVGAAPALAETVATAPDLTEENQPSQAVEEQTAQDTEPSWEQRERDRTVSGFGYDSTQISDAMRTDLDSTIELIAQHGAPETPIVITGHTDAAGDADYNQELSERRAEAMADYLRDQLGDQAPPMETRGRGEEETLAEADDEAQRRVEITYTITTPVPAEPAPEPTSSDTGEESGTILGLPSGAATGLAAGAAAAAGAAGGYALGARRRPAPPDASHRFPTAAPSDSEPTGEEPEQPSEPSEAGSPPEDDDQAPQDTGAPTVIDRRVLAALTHSPGIGLEGPDAHGAARTLLATALTTADTDPEVRLVICADDARHLLGEETTALLAERDTPGIELTDSFPAALTLLHTTMVERQHQLDHAEASTLAELRTHNAEQAPATPPVVLLARSHPDHEADLSGLLLGAEGLDITAVILGRWLLGGTLTIIDGTITEASPPLAALHGANWPTVGSQHVHDLLTARSHRPTPVGAEPFAPPPGAADAAGDDLHAPEPAPQSTLTATAEGEPDTARPAEASTRDVQRTAFVDDTDSAPGPEEPAPAEPSSPSEDNDVDVQAVEEAAAHDNTRQADTRDAGDSTAAQVGTTRPEDPSPPASEVDSEDRPIQVQLMSRIRITVEGSRVELPRRAAYELAAYLALHHDDGVRLERAITDMWPDEDPRRTTRRFHDAVRTLRRQAREPRDDEDLGEPVARDGEIYRLNADVVAVDLWELEAALDDAERTDDLAQRHSRLQTVAHLYTGDLAAEADYPWIEPLRTRLRHRVTQALRGHAEAVAAEHPHVATAVLDRAVDIDPDDEDLHAALMRHHLHHGEAEAARRAFTRYTDHMHRLGAHPNPKLRDLIEENTA